MEESIKSDETLRFLSMSTGDIYLAIGKIETLFDDYCLWKADRLGRDLDEVKNELLQSALKNAKEKYGTNALDTSPDFAAMIEAAIGKRIL
jgi:hypothetical protein